MSAERTAAVWLDLDTGDSGPIVDSDISESWEYATTEVPAMEWVAEPDDGADDDYVSVSRELFNKLVARSTACTCTPSSTP